MGNTALSAILNGDDDVIEATPVIAKRGVNTHLGAMTEDLKSIAQADVVPAEADIVDIDPNTIVFSDQINHRTQEWLSDDNKSFQKLVLSIEQVGQKLPIMVRPVGQGGYELIYGSRRRQACLHLGVDVKAIIANGVSDNEAHELAILENTNHSGLSPLEEARAVLAYKERNAPISDKEVAVVFTKSRQWVGFQVSFANLDTAFIDSCSNPWTITERGTRTLRSTWNGSVKQRQQLQKALEKLKDKKLPFTSLLKHMDGVSGKSGTQVIKDKQGRVIAEVGTSTTKSSRRVRRICVYEDFDKRLLNELIKTLHEDFDAEIPEPN